MKQAAMNGVNQASDGSFYTLLGGGTPGHIPHHFLASEATLGKALHRLTMEEHDVVCWNVLD